MTDLETCPVHDNTLVHAEDQPGYEPDAFDVFDLREHLVCSVPGCGYEVRA